MSLVTFYNISIGGTLDANQSTADYLAGYIAGIRRRESPNFPAAVFAETQSSFGDDDERNRLHHGKPDERGKAVAYGLTLPTGGSYRLLMRFRTALLTYRSCDWV